MGEDQDPAGARGLDEAERGDGLAGAGGVLEPEAPRGARDPRRAPRTPPPPRPPRPDPSRAAPRPDSSSPSSSTSPEWSSSRRWPPAGRPLRDELQLGRRARSACPRARRPGERRAWCRRRGAARPRTAGARGRGSASTCAATRPRAPRGRSSISASAASSASAAGGARARARPRASSPSSTKGSRANSSARFRSSPETGEASATELVSATVGQALLVRGTSRAGRRGRQRGRPSCRRSHDFPRAASVPGPRWTAASLLQHTEAEMGSAIASPGAPPAPFLVVIAPGRRVAAGAACSEARTTSRRPPGACRTPRRRASSTAAARPSRSGSPRSAGTPVVVNKWASWCGPCRLRVSLLQRPGAEAQRRGRVPRRQLERQPGRRRGVPAREPGRRSRTSRTRTWRSRPRSTPCRPSPPPPSTTEGRARLRAPGRLPERAEAGRGHRPLRSLTRRVEVREVRTRRRARRSARRCASGSSAGSRACPLEADRDGRDGEATHIVAVEDERVIGTCRLLLPRPRRAAGAAGRRARAPRRRRGWRDPARGGRGRAPAPAPRRSRCTRRPTRRQLYQRDGYVERGRDVRRGGHRARVDGEARCEP